MKNIKELKQIIENNYKLHEKLAANYRSLYESLKNVERCECFLSDYEDTKNDVVEFLNKFLKN